MTDPVIHPFKVRYSEVDAQGVVFNGWYLSYFDEAMAAFFTERGLPYPDMIAAGYDMQVVHTEIDWKSGIGWQDEVAVAVSCARIGRTSFALDFEVRRDDEVTCSARTVYVVIATDGTGKREIPPPLAAALGEPTPFRTSEP